MSITKLNEAVLSGNLLSVKAVIEAGAKPDEYTLLYAGSSGNLAVVNAVD